MRCIFGTPFFICIMTKSPLHFSLVQFDIHWEHPEKNFLKLDRMLSQVDGSVDITILPEMFSTGFTMNAAAMAEPMDGRAVQWMMETAQRIQSDLVGSLIISEAGNFFNRLIWVDKEGSIKATYDKKHLFSLAGEEKVFTAGTENVLVNVKDWHCKPMICYDLRFPVWARSGKEVDFMLYVANWPEKRVFAWKQLLIARAIENQCYVIGLNRVGWDGEQNYYNGASIVVDPMGKTIHSLGGQEGVQRGKLDGVALEVIRNDLPFLNDADDFVIK